MIDYEGYAPRNRAERVISVARLLLAGFLVTEVALDVTEPRLYGAFARPFAIWFVLYAAALAILTWRRRATSDAVALVTHIADFAVFAMVTDLTRSVTRPFFAYFVYVTICGAIRWHASGALLTGASALGAYVLISLAGIHFRGDEPDTMRFLAASTHLAIVTGLLVYLGAYQGRLQREIQGLAAWPRQLPTREAEAVEELLGHAARLLNAPRLVLVWEEADEPSVRVARWSAGRLETARERPGLFETLIADSLRQSSFLSPDVTSTTSNVVQRVPTGFRFWRGGVMDQSFAARYGITSVVGIRIATESMAGWLFALDKPRTSTDDILLGDIVGRLIAWALELNARIEQLRESAAADERLRLARDLHDTILQSLTATALQAGRARAALNSDVTEADSRLAELEQTILTEQRSLRLALSGLQPDGAATAVAHDWVWRVRHAAMGAAEKWNVRLQLEVQAMVPPVPERTAREVVLMVQEAAANAVKHGGATQISLSLEASDTEVRLAVAYAGRGFEGLEGRHDLTALDAQQMGPRSLKERVSALAGSLVIDSSEDGARVEIAIPITSN